MTTVRKLLDDLGFDWTTGVIVYRPRHAEPFRDAKQWEIFRGHHILDEEFDELSDGTVGPNIVARDRTAVYIRRQYDGPRWMERIVYHDFVNYYLDHDFPFPG